MADSPTPLRALLFDLGNVVIRIDFSRVLAHWRRFSRLPAEAFPQRFDFDEPYKAQEVGRLSEADYLAHLQALFGLECGHDEVRRGFNALYLGPIPETVDAMAQLRGRLPCYALTNTNATHIAELHRLYPGLLESFDRVFASHEIGARKPEAACFEHVLAAIGCAPQEVLFFDDFAEDVDAARALGLQAVHVTTPADVPRALRAHGLLA